MDITRLKEIFSAAATDKADEMAAYMRNRFPFFGINAAQRKLLFKLFPDKKTDAVDWRFVFDCWAEAEREFQYAAVDYLTRHEGQLTKDDLPKLKQLAETKSWWDTVDGIDSLVGGIVLRDETAKPIILEWSVDKNFWIRRIAIDHQLGYKDKTDTELFEKILKNNLGGDGAAGRDGAPQKSGVGLTAEQNEDLKNQKFFIDKAIGWALREYSKTNPDWVGRFVDENQESMAKLSVREASKYLGTKRTMRGEK